MPADNMDINTSALYAGFANLNLPVDSFELGHGLVISRGYGSLTSAQVMSFTRPSPQRPYGEPWAAVEGAHGFQIDVQLYVPVDFARERWFDRLNTVWWIAALIRLRTSPVVIVPVLCNRDFSDRPEVIATTKVFEIETSRRRIVPTPIQGVELALEDLLWIRDHWRSGGNLMHSDAGFNTAFQAFDDAGSSGSVALALISLWGALEELFSPAKQELRFRVSSSIAAFLEPPSEERLSLHKRLLKLYDARSKVAHGTGGNELEPYVDTYNLMRRILLKILEQKTVPSREDVERMLFGA